jgi:hypothetical protein
MEMSLLTENKKAKPKTSTEASIVPAGTKLVTFFRHNATKVFFHDNFHLNITQSLEIHRISRAD